MNFRDCMFFVILSQDLISLLNLKGQLHLKNKWCLLNLKDQLHFKNKWLAQGNENDLLFRASQNS